MSRFRLEPTEWLTSSIDANANSSGFPKESLGHQRETEGCPTGKWKPPILRAVPGLEEVAALPESAVTTLDIGKKSAPAFFCRGGNGEFGESLVPPQMAQAWSCLSVASFVINPGSSPNGEPQSRESTAQKGSLPHKPKE